MKVEDYEYEYPILYKIIHENAKHHYQRYYSKSSTDRKVISAAFTWAHALHYPSSSVDNIWSALQRGDIESVKKSNPELFEVLKKGDLIIKSNGLWET